MIDSGSAPDWRPSTYIVNSLGLRRVDYLFITNADQDHMSDLQGLFDAGIDVGVLLRNYSYTADQIRQIKRQGGVLSADAERYVGMCATYNQPAVEPFDQYMGGIMTTTYCNAYPRFPDTNNLSLAVFIKFGAFKILFPGDLEKPGWRALLQQPAFRAELADTDVFFASHHGRENGFCAEVFDYCQPSAVIISDKPIEHETQQMVPDYRAVVRDAGVTVRTTGRQRHVLTTRRDGAILITAGSDNHYTIDTEHRG
ncbi:Metal-dependent hydrolase, beta-lactamase superfamily II [Solimonas aquatica]|uniref:Metal-dependent hydrolase, beta-lactamase superfamily II n=2 Tax=Solimonas aquatica TaxID=489703 RepID=A0A1H9A8C3_9GAMM|nr:Metal-dependent hydrolase, beta-lactamase superfamily II [Solimonas aquatica]